MAPSSEPAVVPATGSYNRSTVKLPVAPAKRPVPPVIVAVSTMYRRVVPGTGEAAPVKSAVSVSPLAAVNV